MTGTGEMDEEAVLRAELSVLEAEHRDLDAAITALEEKASPSDRLTIQRLKKKKLTLKDRIAAIQDRLIPDIIA